MAIALHCMILNVRSLTIFCSRPIETLLGILFQSSASFSSSSHCLFTFTLPLTLPIPSIHCLPTLAFLLYAFSLPLFTIKPHELLPSTLLAGCMQLKKIIKKNPASTSLGFSLISQIYRRVRHLAMAKASRHGHGDFQNSHFSKSESQELQLNKLLGRSASIGTHNHPITALASPGLIFSSSVKEVSDCLLILVLLRS